MCLNLLKGRLFIYSSKPSKCILKEYKLTGTRQALKVCLIKVWVSNYVFHTKLLCSTTQVCVNGSNSARSMLH